jgi:uncharacterized delta-60 repeat protein
MKTVKTLVVIAICLFASLETFAFADGDLDPTFGTGGKVFTQFSPHGPQPATDIAVQSDGKIVVVSGALASFLQSAMNMARYNPDGSLDTTFGGGGKITTFVGGGPQNYNSVLVEPDGNILVAGSAGRLTGPPDQWVYRLIIARFNPNGTQLTTFAGLPSELPGGLQVNDIALAPGNKIISVAVHFSNVYLLRYNPNGSLDTSFDGDGIVNFSAAEVNAVSAQTDGKVLVAGKLGSDWAVRRFNSDGSPDTSFDGDGIFNAPVGTGSSAAKEMIVKPDGRILTVGAALNPGAVTALVQLNPDGSLDNAFDDDGKVFTTVPATNGGLDAELQRDGKIVAFSGGTGDTFGLSRYLPNGALDMTFSGDGIATETVAAKPGAIALQPDGKIVASGNTMAGGFGDSFAVARFIATAPARVPTGFDYDGDGKSDISIYRPSNGQWWLNKSSANVNVFQFGTSTDKLAPGDYTGDGKTDVAFWRPETGEWFILRSEDSSYFAFFFGLSTDIPAPADFDGDGTTEAAVFRPSTGTWFIRNSAGGATTISFGTTGDVPVAADYDGDGTADVAIYRPSNGQWWLNRSTDGVAVYTFGISTDKVVPGDYTGDGRADIAFWRPSDGHWFILRSEDASYFSFPFGIGSDIAAPGDYDGDGKTDAAVFRPSSGTWFILKSAGGVTESQFGTPSDFPTQASFIP